ncbi:MAG: MBL fold metallo-hydrolase [Bacteroidota bacterium]|jgi:glyoxylase-like metal-dependent hydrolase (beta-lactamase superfamily II)
MQLHVIETGTFKLDGGAMFGVVPKKIWNKINPADHNNLCTWAMRCLLVETGNQLILIDCGLGDKQDDKFFSHYEPSRHQSLTDSIAKAGFTPNEVTDVFLTHLHFDHCGGAIIRNGDHYEPQFRNARYYSHQKHWDWAIKPNAREKASFLKENIMPIQESGQLTLFTQPQDIAPGLSFIEVYGHTEAMMLPVIRYKEQRIVYVADLLPSAGHIPLPYVMSYDVRPLVTLDEKNKFLNDAIQHNDILFFEHDPIHQACMLEAGEKGAKPTRYLTLSEL